MATFKRTNTRAFSKSGVKVTPDTLYWKRLQFPVTVKEFTSVSHIDISPTEPHYIAVTSGPKVDVYHQQTLHVWRNLSRFQKSAYGASFRSDGQLLVAGSEEGQVKLFNYKQKQLLRIFKGHDGAVHQARFVHGVPRIVSFSDDKTSVLWDITDESQICKLSGHTDFIRAGVTSEASEHIVLSGGYDHIVKMWDTRTGSSVITVDHGAPVESLVCFPSGGVFVSAGGTYVKVWDVIGGRLLSKLSQHHKTITSLCLATDGKRLMSGSLDRHVKIYDVNTYSVVHTLDYPAPILSMAIAPGDTTVAVGMISEGSGLVSFQHRWDTRQGEVVKEKTKKNIRSSITEDYRLTAGDKIVSHETKEIMSHYDTMLRKFQYSRALDMVMRRNITGRSPHVTVAIFQELIRRGGLRTALAGRDVKTLTPVLRFLTKHIRDPNYKRVLMDVADTLIDVYGDTIGEFPALVNLFRRLQEEVELELRLIREYVSLMGAIQMFLTVSSPKSVSNEPLRTVSRSVSSEGVMMPSQAAQTAPEVIVDVS